MRRLLFPLIALVCLWAAPASAAVWYWVSASAANFNTNNWATSSGGTASGQPAAGDTAIFDGGSSSTCTLNVSISLASFDEQGGTGNFAGTITHNTGVTITLTGTTNALRLSSGSTYTPATVTSIFAFTGTGTATVTTAGKNFAAITINSVGGTVTQEDAWNVTAVANSIITLTEGTWNSNGFAVSANLIAGSNSNTRAWTLPSSVTVGNNYTGGQILWNFSTDTGLTFTPGSGTITFLPPSANASPGFYVELGSPSGGYNNVVFSTATTKFVAEVTFTTGVTFANLTIDSGWAITLGNTGTINVTNASTWTGTAANPISLQTQLITSNPVVFSTASGTTTLTWAYIANVEGSGGATFNANNTLALGNTTGWTVTAPTTGGGGGSSAIGLPGLN